MNVFPALPGQEFVVKKSPTWATTVKRAYSGREVRASRQSAPKWNFKIAYEFLRDRAPTTSELQNLFAFFNSAQGQFSAWYFLDPFDNLVSGQQIGVGNGATTSFQLQRTIGGFTTYPFIEPVYGATNVQVEVGGVPAANWAPGNFGSIIFTTPPANGAAITWSGSFYFLCRFSQDNLDAQQMVKDMWSVDGIEFESLLP
jgi:uncharacterized protein (TIGR02217 family)